MNTVAWRFRKILGGQWTYVDGVPTNDDIADAMDHSHELETLVPGFEAEELLREALNAMLNLSPRVKEYDGCFGRMAGGIGGEDCECTACKIKREIGHP